MQQLLVGLDVGSTTVKAVVVDAATDQILWQDYQRHETRQPEKVLEFLKRMESEAGIGQHTTRVFVTGSGGGPSLCRKCTQWLWPSRSSIRRCTPSSS